MVNHGSILNQERCADCSMRRAVELCYKLNFEFLKIFETTFSSLSTWSAEAIWLVINTIVFREFFASNKSNKSVCKTMKSKRNRNITQRVLYQFGQQTCLCPVHNILLRFYNLSIIFPNFFKLLQPSSFPKPLQAIQLSSLSQASPSSQ